MVKLQKSNITVSTTIKASDKKSQAWNAKAGSNHSSQFRNSQILFPFPLSTLNSHTNKIASNSSSGLTTLAIDS
jgi:hypothetical protein